MKAKFIEWEELNKNGLHKYKRDLPMGQQWGQDRNFIANGRGEGFKVHGGTNRKEIADIIDALNERDYKIAILEAK